MRALLLLAGLLLCAQIRAAERAPGLIDIAGCVLCHSAENGAELAGGRALTSPFGVIYTPNISSDNQYGIGRWSYAEFEQAIRAGIAPDGHYYYPAFPYTSYSALTDSDVRRLYDELQDSAPQTRSNTEPQLHWPYSERGLLSLWRFFNFQPRPFVPDATRPASWNRGAYLVNAVLHCGECHTPRTSLGASRSSHALTGARMANGHRAPNLTPLPSALGAWEAEDIAAYLLDGRSDYTRRARNEMREFIDAASRHLEEEDRLAIAAYLHALAPQQGPRRRHHGPRQGR